MEFEGYPMSGDISFPSFAHQRQLIKCVWYAVGKFHRPHHEQILPSGVAEVIFNLSEPVGYHRTFDNIAGTLPRCFVNGVNVNDVTLIKQKNQHFVGVQLYPFALRALFGIPANEFTNSVTDLTLLDKSLTHLCDTLAEQTEFAAQVQILLSWFDSQMARKKRSIDLPSISHFYGEAHLNAGRIAKLADHYSLTERTLRRRCNEWLGMSTEAFIQYRKYLESLSLLHVDDLKLTDVGYRAGYYDQSHFIREFRAFTSLSPKEYRLQKSPGIGHIFRYV